MELTYENLENYLITLGKPSKRTEDEVRKSKHNSDIVLKEIKTKLEAYHLSLGLKDWMRFINETQK